MKISLVIPQLEIDLDKRDILQKCLDSMAGQYNELIVIAEKMDNLAEKINLGMSKSSGDYIIVSNDDLTLLKGTLDDLCDPKHVTVPKVIFGIDKLFHGHIWCMPRKIYEDVGPMHEGYDGFYYDDSDYWMSIEAKGYEIIKKENVVVVHPRPATTLSKLQKGGRIENNRKVFVKRWGEDAVKRVR